MRHLDRSRVTAPSCLSETCEGWTYSDLRGAEKEEIRKALFELQGTRCAYCERRTGTDRTLDGHIEHFRKQANHAALTLTWENLFWSCNEERTCGKHKDKCNRPKGSDSPQATYDEEDLIHPSFDDPEAFLLFVTDGTVTPKSGLDDTARRRAEETIRVFQLNAPPLHQGRCDALGPIVRAVETAWRMGADFVREYIDQELHASTGAPFPTAIRHFLLSVKP